MSKEDVLNVAAMVLGSIVVLVIFAAYWRLAHFMAREQCLVLAEVGAVDSVHWGWATGCLVEVDGVWRELDVWRRSQRSAP